ncbi:MAG: DUF3830 family protein [Proteobacteria bacterium]|nr:DUF3830 family protein [Pseudomonadota bacterium]
MLRHLEFTMAGAVARARLLDDLAPETCAIVWSLLPLSGPCGHVLLAGTSCALHIDPSVVAPEENATGLIHTGDVMFVHYGLRERHGFPEAESKIYWAYDRYCQPKTPGKMTAEFPTVFAEFRSDATAFFQACRDTFYGGRKPLVIRGILER